MERQNRQERGKGYALEWAFKQLLSQDDETDAYIIVDADTLVASGFSARHRAALVGGRRSGGAAGASRRAAGAIRRFKHGGLVARRPDDRRF